MLSSLLRVENYSVLKGFLMPTKKIDKILLALFFIAFSIDVFVAFNGVHAAFIPSLRWFEAAILVIYQLRYFFILVQVPSSNNIFTGRRVKLSFVALWIISGIYTWTLFAQGQILIGSLYAATCVLETVNFLNIVRFTKNSVGFRQ